MFYLKYHHIIALFLIFLALSAIKASECTASGKFIIKFASVAPDGSTWIKHMRNLDVILREKSQGKLGFKIYAGGIAGDENDVLKKMRIGQIHCTAFSGVGISYILPMVRVLDLPFLFRNREEIKTLQNELEHFFSDQFRYKGFEFLSWAEVGNVHLFSNKPIRKVEDLKGLKIWTWSGDPISKQTFLSMNSNPIPLSITDVRTSLATGMIDTVYAPPLGVLSLQWYSNVRYMSAIPIAHSTGVVLITKKYFDSIPGDLSDLLKQELAIQMSALTGDLVVQSREAIKLIQKKGVELIPMPSGQDLENFYNVNLLVAQELADRVIPKEILQKVQDTLDRIRGISPSTQ